MHLTVSELTRLLEYIPKETAPDLHVKILGKLTSIRYYEANRGLKREDRRRVQENFIASLSESELEAWQVYSESHIVLEDQDVSA